MQSPQSFELSITEFLKKSVIHDNLQVHRFSYFKLSNMFLLDQKNKFLISKISYYPHFLPYLSTLKIFENSNQHFRVINKYEESPSLLLRVETFVNCYRKSPMASRLNSYIPNKEYLNSNTCIADYSNSEYINLIYNTSTFLSNADTHASRLPLKHLPWLGSPILGFTVDTEYKDLRKIGTSPFKNERDVYPISMGVGIFSYLHHHEVVYRNFITNKNNYDFLQNYNLNPCLKEPLRYVNYANSINTSQNDFKININNGLVKVTYNGNVIHEDYKPYTDDSRSQPILIEENTCLKSILDEMDALVYGSSKQSFLYYISPSCLLTKTKTFKNMVTIPFYMYFSVKDLRYFLGECIYFFIEKYICVRRNVSFNYKLSSPFAFMYAVDDGTTTKTFFFKLKVIDGYGLTGGSLKDYAFTTNIKLSLKDDLNKEDIEQSLLQKPNEYLTYCQEDTVYLFQMSVKFNILNFETYSNFKINKFPLLLGSSFDGLRPTNGSNVAKLLSDYIYNLNDGISDTLDDISIIHKHDGKSLNTIKGMQMGSAAYLRYLGGSAIEGSFVSGGRVCNERALENSFSYGADIDMVGCYGSAVRNMFYPIGTPMVLKNEKGDFVMNLGTFLKKKKKDLIRHLWYGVVSTDKPLSFSTDLFVSKIVSSKSLRDNTKTMGGIHIKGEQMVLLKEVKHAVIIQEHLDIINSMASNREKKELYERIQIEMVSYYPAKYRCESPEEFNAKVVSHKIKIHKKNLKRNIKPKENASREDERAPYWYAVPMDKFIGPLIDKRRESQRRYKNGEGDEFNAIQTFLKKTINMVYGCTASQYFDVNNLCFANNITGLAKTNVWMMSKAMNLILTITDGGPYELNRVNYFWLNNKNKKPSLEKMALNTLYQTGSFKPLGCIRNGIRKKTPNYNNMLNHIMKYPERKYLLNLFIRVIDKVAKDHIIQFCNRYNLQHIFIYDLEHKPNNTFYKAACLNRGHYCLINVYKETISKVRGFQQREGSDDVLSPIFEVLKKKALNEPAVIKNLASTHSGLISPTDLPRLKRMKSIGPFTGIHDTYISTKILGFKYDCGKFATYENYKNLQSKYYGMLRFEYLNNVEFNSDKQQYELDSNLFWKRYHEQLDQLSFKEPLQKRVSKEDSSLFNNISSKGLKIDEYFVPEALQQLDLTDFFNYENDKVHNGSNETETDLVDQHDTEEECFEDFSKIENELE